MTSVTPKVDPYLVLDERGTLKASADAARAQSSLVFGHRTRLLVLFLTTMCLTATISNSIALNFTVICMYDESAPVSNITGQHPHLYSELQKSWLFSAIAIGTLLGTLPTTYLTTTYGMKFLFLLYGSISTTATLFMPLMVGVGFPMVFLMRICQGIAVATSFPSMGAIIAEWSTLRKSGTYIAWMSTHLQLGQIFTMPVAGALCESAWGWPALYYLQGGLSVLFFGIFYWFYEDKPTLHKNVSHKELTTIQKNKVVRVLEDGEKEKVPYRDIFTDWSVIGIMCSCFGASIGFHFFFQYGPVYLNQVQGFDVTETGFAAALPFILSTAAKFVVGPCSDSIPCVSERWRVMMFASISQYSMAACFLLLAWLPPEARLLSQACFTASIVFSGLNAVGVTKSSQMISGPYIHFLMTINMFITSVVILLIPFLVAIFAPNGAPSEWATLFIGTGILVVVVTTIFNVTAEVTPRPWVTRVTKKPDQSNDDKRDYDTNNQDSAPTEYDMNQNNTKLAQSDLAKRTLAQSDLAKRTSINSVD